MPSDQLSLEEKRQVIYSSLLRYSSESIPLRQRVLDRVIRGALVGSTSASPLTVGGIRKNLTAGGCALDIRDDVVQASLARLQTSGDVEHAEHRKKHAYYLSASAETAIGKVIYERKQLLDSVLARLFKDTAEFITPDTTRRVFNAFIFECFARSGRSLAQATVGRVDGDELLKSVDARAAFAEATRNESLSGAQLESLETRCFGFLTNKDAVDVKLRFDLTQGYYFTELLGLNTNGFSPLTDQAFKGSDFYCDTNVIMTGLLLPEEEQQDFREVLAIAKRIGMNLKVTRATLDEVREVITSRVPSIEKVLDVVASELVDRTRDQVLMAFLRRRAENPRLTISNFISFLDTLDTTIQDAWGMELVERTTDEILAGCNCAREEAVIDESAEEARGWGKSLHVRRHDAAHLFLVRDGRKTNTKTWFLTRDRTLGLAAERLFPHEPPFCFSQIGLLHSISPFLAGAAEERAFTEIFAAVMEDQFKPIGAVFDLGELRVMADFHSDVMAMPKDQLLLAFDFVKSRTLQGRQYKESDVPRVSLDLKKFLTSSREEQMEAMRVEAERMRQAMVEERRTRDLLERERATDKTEKEELNAQIADLLGEVRDLKVQQQQTSEGLVAEKKRNDSVLRRNRGTLAVAGVVIGSIVARFSAEMTSGVLSWAGIKNDPHGLVTLAIRIAGALVFSIPPIWFLRREKWSRDLRLALVAGVVILALVLFTFSDSPKVALIADLLAVACFVAPIVLSAKEGAKEDGTS